MNSALNERVAYDKLSFFYLSLPIILVGQLLGALLLSAMEMTIVDLYPIGVWLLLNIIMFLYRFYHYSLFKKKSEKKKHGNAKLWLDRYYTNVLLSGIIWGSSALLLFPASNLLGQMILLLFLFAVGFSSLGVLATKKDLLLSYVFVMYGPIIWRLFFLSGELYLNIAYAVLSLVLLMILVANYYGKVINKSLEDRQQFIDIKISHEKLRERFFSLFERAPVGIYYYNRSLVLQDVNRQFRKMSGIENKEQLIGISLYQNIEDAKILEIHENVFKHQSGNYRGPFLMANSHAKEDLYVDLSTIPMLNNDGDITGGIAIVNNITNEVTAQEKMMRDAYYDMLTNIPNRTLLMDKLKNLAEVKKSTKDYGALLFLDIDNFKKINTTFGQDIGDKVIKQVAHRIEAFIGSHETLARMAGDKFVILIPTIGKDENTAKEAASQYVVKFNQYFVQPIQVVGKDHHVSFSIGAILFADTDATAFDLLKRAETAMYEAKKSTRGSMKFYQDSMSTQVEEQLMLENDIHKAIKDNEFEMYYQPQLNVKSNKIIGAEALIRWHHPERGLILPTAFIPLAEESGIIIKLEEWIFDRIFKDVKEMNRDMGKFSLHHISINISTVHFLEPHFVEKMMLLVKKHRVKPEWFELEITESGIIRNIDDAIRKIKELKGFGFAFSIDDFGTGYSSLSHLKELPVDVIKIDQSFIRNMNTDDEMIVEAVVAIGQKFHLGIVAEGVENKDTLKYLQHVNCDTYQGYLASTAVPLKDFEALLKFEKKVKE
ncbi:EAL domain-containing protein [Sulfurovum sp.]|uniref:putative bifunctional diguanylate cyclase/phosphodiesterase n=1 Tax=Sulfurovum sp. TaxID=1969726 RepID=UPI0025CFFB9A|nr:EAL domain-containing protein [Sulfurovum sp.]